MAVLSGVPQMDLLYVAIAVPGLAGIVIRAVIAAVCLLAPTLLMGASNVMDRPARFTTAFELVPRDIAMKAVALNSIGFSLMRVLGPAEAPVFRLNNYFRFHFQLQSASAAVLHQVLREVLAVVRAPSGVEYQLDIDPYNML